MSVRFDHRPLEYTMTHRIGAGGMSEACQRPEAVRAIATRLMGWRATPETCRNCHHLPAVSLRAAIPLCSRCRENRDAFLGALERDAVGRAPAVVRSDDNTSQDKQLRGHSFVFNKKSVDMGFFEIIRPRAADRMMADKPDLRALWNHDSSSTLARYSAGTLRYEKVTRGVAVEIDPPRWAHGHIESVERRDITGQSFANIGAFDGSAPAGLTPENDGDLSEARFEAAVAYQRQNPEASWGEAVQKSRGQKAAV